MNDINEIIQKLRAFRDERDWSQFHNPKDLAIALSIESSELLELFLWKTSDQVAVGKIKEELADVLSFAFLMADKYELNIRDIILEKLTINAAKYPIEKAKGNAKKYTDL